jgi:uncharacterized protein YkwD
MEQDLLARHNGERAAAGLPPLQVSGTLTDVARRRAQDMAANNYFSHYSPSGETAFTILGRMGYNYGTGGENIARNNYPDAQSVSTAMSGFMQSPGHRANVLEPKFRVVGIGMAVGAGGMKYFAVVFSGN